MANYGVTWTSGGSATQNVTTADTITVATGSTGGWFVINTTNCSTSPSSGSATTSCVISFSATGSYSCTIVNSSFTASWTISGTVSSGAQAPANPTSGNYTIDSTATGDLTVNISGGASGEAYALCDASGLDYATKGSNLYVVANRRNISNNTTAVTVSNYSSYSDNVTCTTFISSYSSGAGFTIDNYSLPTSGNTKTFYIYRYRYTSQSPAGAGQYLAGDTFTVTRTSYTAPANPTASNQTISSTYSGDLSVPISGGIVTEDAYSLCVTSGLTTNSQVVSDRIAAMTPYTSGATFDIPAAELPSAGNTKTYYIYRYKYSTYGGEALYYEGNSFTVTRNTATTITWTWTPFNISSGEIKVSDLQSFFGGSNPISMSEYYARNNESITDPTGYVNQYYYTTPSSYQYYDNSAAVIKSSSSSTPVGGTLYWDGYTYSWDTDYTSSSSTFGITTANGGASVYRGNLLGQVGTDWWWAIYVSTFEYRIGNLGIPEHDSGDPINLSDFYASGYLSGYWEDS